MANKKTSIEVAQVEIQRWFKACRFKDKKIESNKGEDGAEGLEDTLLEGICEGLITVDEAGILSQKLEFPFKSGKESLTFKPRLLVKQLRIANMGINPNDAHGRVVAAVAARTGENKNIIDELDTSDFDISSAIIAYFL